MAPETTVPVTTYETVSTRTVYAVVGAVIVPNASSYVSVKSVPATLTDAEENTGARKSGATVELFVAAKSLNENMSFPVVSCIAALVVSELSAGAS